MTDCCNDQDDDRVQRVLLKAGETMDLYLDSETMALACRRLAAKSDALVELQKSITENFEGLRSDWDSKAGEIFFQRFEDDIYKNLEQYAKVLAYMTENLTTASTQYEEVFRAADVVAEKQLG